MQVRDFQAIIGRETKEQCRAAWGGLPDVLLACVGGGSNAIGLFHDFVVRTHFALLAFQVLISFQAKVLSVAMTARPEALRRRSCWVALVAYSSMLCRQSTPRFLCLSAFQSTVLHSSQHR